MTYYDELKQIRTELRKEFKKTGIKASMTGGKGTALLWTYISPKGESWSDKDLKILQKDFGFHVGHPRNSLTVPMEKLKTNLGSVRLKGFKSSPKYQKFKKEFVAIADKQKDTGTCCLGAGTIVSKDGMDFDFIEQRGQSETRNLITQKILDERARKLGLKLKLEYGRMD